jgi:hypothetical protein
MWEMNRGGDGCVIVQVEYLDKKNLYSRTRLVSKCILDYWLVSII